MTDIRIDHNSDNTKLHTSSLGEIELKFISGGDSQRFFKLIYSDIPTKQTAIKILHCQLLKPVVSLEDFSAIENDEMVAILRAFVKNEDYTFKHFDASSEPYSAFINALKMHHRKHAERVAKMLTPNHQAITQSLAAIAKQFQAVSISPSMHSIINNAIGQSHISKSLNITSVGLAKSLTGQQLSSLQGLKPIIEAQTSAMSSIAKIIAPSINAWQTWAKNNAELFNGTAKILKQFQQEYKISEREANKLLAKYKWFVSPSLDIRIIHKVSQLNKRTGNQSKAVNSVFTNYFEKNGWSILDILLDSWKDNKLFDSRRKILTDTFRIVQAGSDSDINVANAVLPTLIVQVDGILKDFMKENMSESFNDHDKIKKLKNSGLLPPMSDLDELGMNVFLDILFQSSNPGTPLHTPFNLNRHKILHAENTRYGRKDYLVRVIMVLDILAHLEPNKSSDKKQ